MDSAECTDKLCNCWVAVAASATVGRACGGALGSACNSPQAARVRQKTSAATGLARRRIVGPVGGVGATRSGDGARTSGRIADYPPGQGPKRLVGPLWPGGRGSSLTA